MRIVHTCLRYPPATGGVETYVQTLVEKTRDVSAGRDVRVLTSKMRTHGPITDLAPDQLLDDPPYVQRLHVSSTPLLSYPRLQTLWYYLGHHQPDVVHGYSYWYQPADVAARYAARHHKPFIFHPMYYTNAHRRKLTWRAYTALRGRTTFAHADVVAVISPYEQRLIEQAGYPVKRFVLLPPGVDVTHFQQPVPNPYSAQGLTGKILLSISRLSQEKGLHDIITALPAIRKAEPDTHLVIIGEDFGAEAELKQLVNHLNLTPHVHFWGRVSDDQRRAALQHATAFVHGSYYEAFGIVLAEAMAAGIPVVARNVAAVPYLITPAQTGLLFNTQPELVHAVTNLLSSPHQVEQLVQTARTHVQQHFTWEATIAKLLNLYDELGVAPHL